MTKEKIENFVNFRFVPSKKRTHITRILLFWIFNIPFYFFDRFAFITGVILSVINIFSSVLFIKLAITKAETEEAKFLSEGIAYTYYSIVCLIAGFIAMSIPNGYNFLLLFALILIYLLSAALFLLAVIKNIKNDIYNEKNLRGGGNIFIPPFAGGLLGISVGRFISSVNSSQQLSFYILGACLLFLSYILSIGYMSFIKLYFLKNLSKCQD